MHQREAAAQIAFYAAPKAYGPVGVAEPEDLASMVVFLGGPGAAKLTGQVISVNGGISVC